MKAVRSAVPFFLLFVVTLGLVAGLSGSAQYLANARAAPMLAAAGLYSTGFLIFAAIWAALVRRVEIKSPAADGGGALGVAGLFRIGILSLAGLLTPFNIGTDILRSVLGKHYLHLGYAPTAAASVITRECKLHVSLALLVVVVAAAGAGVGQSTRQIALGFAGLTGLALAFAAFRSNASAGLIRSLGICELADTTRSMSRLLGWRDRASIYLLFAVGFAAEWQALRLCFQSLGVAADPATVFTGYGVMHFLSRAPVLPLGVGVVEAGGFAWLRAIHVPIEQAGAVIVLWGCLRVAVPYLQAAVAFASFAAGRRR